MYVSIKSFYFFDNPGAGVEEAGGWQTHIFDVVYIQSI
jgi:hypothetical protein